MGRESKKEGIYVTGLIALVGRPEVPKGQEEIKPQVADILFFSFKILCCHDDTWFHLN